MSPVICTAIARRQLLMFGYADAVRVVEPHIYGRNTAGHDALSAWLRPGQSRADPEGGWRMYLVEGLEAVQALPEVFAGAALGVEPRRSSLRNDLLSSRTLSGPMTRIRRSRAAGAARRSSPAPGRPCFTALTLRHPR